MNPNLLAELWQNHSGKIIGVLFGLFCGVFILTFGFFRALFVFLCMLAGYLVGKRIDEKEDLMDIVDKLLPPGYHR